MNATTMGQVQEYIKMLVAGIMEERFKDITSKANAPFIDGSFYVTSLIYEDIDAVIGEVNLKDDNILPGLEAFYTEIERMRRFGFLKDEFEENWAQYSWAIGWWNFDRDGDIVDSITDNDRTNQISRGDVTLDPGASFLGALSGKGLNFNFPAAVQ